MKWVKPYNRPFSAQKDLIAVCRYFVDNPYHKLTYQIQVPYGKNKADYYYLAADWNKLMCQLAKEALFNPVRFYDWNIRKYQKEKVKLLRLAGRLRSVNLSSLSARELLKRY